jgi:hypothetical protein
LNFAKPIRLPPEPRSASRPAADGRRLQRRRPVLRHRRRLHPRPGSLSEGFIDGDVVECNFHNGQFDIKTGEIVSPPCMIPVKTYPRRSKAARCSSTWIESWLAISVKIPAELASRFPFFVLP